MVDTKETKVVEVEGYGPVEVYDTLDLDIVKPWEEGAGSNGDVRKGKDYRLDPIRSPLKAVRRKCLECCCLLYTAVRDCDCNCALYPFRMGKNPFRKKRVYTEEQKTAMAERLRKARGSLEGLRLEEETPES